MDIAPFVSGHRPEVFYLLTATAAMQLTAKSTGTRRQDILHNKAGESQCQQIDKANAIDNKIQWAAFYNITPLPKPPDYTNYNKLLRLSVAVCN